MTVHDYTIDNSSGSSVRTDIQNALQAIQSQNSTTATNGPTAQLAVFTPWADIQNNIFKRRNLANNAWVSYREHDGTVLIPDGSAANPSIHPTSDPNTGLFKPSDDQLAVSCGGTARLTVGTTAVTTTEPIRFPDANASLPSITFGSDTSTGFFKPGTHLLAVATNGVERVRLANSILTVGVDIEVNNQADVRFKEQTANGSSHVGIQAPAALSTDIYFTLPATDGSNGDALTTNGSGALSFSSLSFVPIGAVMMWSSTSVPTGWLECNGQYLNRTGTHAALFAVVGTTWGAPSGSTFMVPDLRGEFVRGWDHGRTVDSGRNLNDPQGDAVKTHQHEFGGDDGLGPQGGYTAISDMAYDAVSTTSGAGKRYRTKNDTPNITIAENRPRNIAIMFIIKAV